MDESSVIEYWVLPDSGVTCEVRLGFGVKPGSTPEDAREAVVKSARPGEFSSTRILTSGSYYRRCAIDEGIIRLDDNPYNWGCWAVVLCIK